MNVCFMFWALPFHLINNIHSVSSEFTASEVFCLDDHYIIVPYVQQKLNHLVKNLTSGQLLSPPRYRGVTPVIQPLDQGVFPAIKKIQVEAAMQSAITFTI